MKQIQILLLIIFLFMMNIFSNRYAISLVSYFASLIIIYWITKDYYITFGLATILLVIYNLYWEQYEVNEGFENEDNKKEPVSGDLTSMITALKEISEKSQQPEKNNDNLQKLTQALDPMDVFDEIGDVDDNDNQGKVKNEGGISKDGIPDILRDEKYFDNLTPAAAQRETFRLIKTMQQLDDTMKGMAPILKQGANIIDRFKKLGIQTNSG